MPVATVTSALVIDVLGGHGMTQGQIADLTGISQKAGVPISIVSKWAGHYDASFTMKTYVHASDDEARPPGARQDSQDRLATVRNCERPSPPAAAKAASHVQEKDPDLRIRGALGGTRTPNLLIRRDLRAHPLPAHMPIDLLECCSAMRNEWRR
jgi:hypothetical protein